MLICKNEWVLSPNFSDVPTCKHNTESLVGAMKQETIQVICEMASDPPHVQVILNIIT